MLHYHTSTINESLSLKTVIQASVHYPIGALCVTKVCWMRHFRKGLRLPGLLLVLPLFLLHGESRGKSW